MAALKGSLDTRSSSSQEASSDHTHSLTQKTTEHKYSEINTRLKVSRTRHASLSDNLHIKSDSCNCLAPELIPPPPNTRGRSNSTPHFYYILEQPEKEKEGIGRKSSTLDDRRGHRRVGSKEGSLKEKRSREGSIKSGGGWREGSWKKDVAARDGSLRHGMRSRDGSIKVVGRSKDESLKMGMNSIEGNLKKEVGWKEEGIRWSGEQDMQPRKGSIRKESYSPERCQKFESSRSREGSLKNEIRSRDGSWKREVVKSREASIKKEVHILDEYYKPQSKSREGSVKKEAKTREGGSLKHTPRKGDASLKKGNSLYEISWRPELLVTDDMSPIISSEEQKMEVTLVEEKNSCFHHEYSINSDQMVAESVVLFDDPKYAIVDIHDEPILVTRYPSLDPIIPHRMKMDALCRGKATSSMSLQEPSLDSSMKHSPIYLSRDITPTRDIVLAEGRGSLRMSVPPDTSY